MPNYHNAWKLILAGLVVACCHSVSDVNAQVMIGGRNGVVIGGGMGLRIGGRDGVQFGGGQGARFGPARDGVQFGAGQGARFGPADTGVQFGGGQGAKFGSLQFGGRGNYGGMNNSTYGSPYSSSAQANRMVVRLSSEAKQPIKYSLNGTPFQLMPGRETFLQSGQQWTLGFVPAPGKEPQTRQITSAGIYEFSEGEDGWVLNVRKPEQGTPAQVKRAATAPRGNGAQPVLAAPLDETAPVPPPEDPAEAPKPVTESTVKNKPATQPPAATKRPSPPTEDVPAEKTETRRERSILEWNDSKKSGAPKGK